MRAPNPIQPSAPISQHAHVEAQTPVVAAPPPQKGPPPREVIHAWLEENGLAWAGGGALALGGLFLVTYAAQRGVFTLTCNNWWEIASIGVQRLAKAHKMQVVVRRSHTQAG